MFVDNIEIIIHYKVIFTHTTCGSMADIQSATAEIGEEKKKEEVTTGQKYNGLPYSIGRT